ILKERSDLTTSEEMHSEKGRIYVSHCPERVLPGHILKELVENDRIIGGLDKESTKRTVEFYKQFVKGKILDTNARTAEMAKLTENSFRDVNIAFANELSLICDKLNINVWELIRLANRHPRVN
ncbi:UDP-N-acetyl-D-mannosamine dehydrogenase, partial [Bacillus cereus]